MPTAALGFNKRTKQYHLVQVDDNDSTGVVGDYGALVDPEITPNYLDLVIIADQPKFNTDVLQ